MAEVVAEAEDAFFGAGAFFVAAGAADRAVEAAGGEGVEQVRYRTVGDMSCTGAIRSRARTIPDIINELEHTRVTERGQTRADDKTSDAAMEDRKKTGYF